MNENTIGLRVVVNFFKINILTTWDGEGPTLKMFYKGSYVQPLIASIDTRDFLTNCYYNEETIELAKQSELVDIYIN